MKWTTAISQHSETTPAFREACAQLDISSDEEVDVLLVFFSEHHVPDARELALAMVNTFPEAICVGCNAAGVVGSTNLRQSQASLSVTAGRLPDVKIRPIRFESDVHDRPDFDWKGELNADEDPNFLILSQATGFETEGLLHALDHAFPAATKFGALVDAGATIGNRLILEGHVYNNGAVGLALSGNLRVDTIVTQACRPVGEPLIVTRHSQNVIHRFNRGNPMEVFREIVDDLNPVERELAQNSMFVGIGVENQRGLYQPGTFITRNIIGFNPKNGDLAIAAPIGDHEVIQFHLMDPGAAEAEFERAVNQFAARIDHHGAPDGALLFSGIAGDQNRSDKALQESDFLRACFGEMSLGGFFSEGEIAPVGQKSCVHGYASSVTIFRESGS